MRLLITIPSLMHIYVRMPPFRGVNLKRTPTQKQSGVDRCLQEISCKRGLHGGKY